MAVRSSFCLSEKPRRRPLTMGSGRHPVCIMSAVRSCPPSRQANRRKCEDVYAKIVLGVIARTLAAEL